MSNVPESQERPNKRQRLSPTDANNEAEKLTAPATIDPNNPNSSGLSAESAKETDVGITWYVSSNTVSFQALLKKRYTDFLVNEILPGGEVVHLTNTSVSSKPQPASRSAGINARATQNGAQVVQSDVSRTDAVNTANEAEESKAASKQHEAGKISDEDRQKLTSYLNEQAVTDLLKLDEAIDAHPTRKPKEHALVRTEFTSDRSLRAEIHGAIRQMFSSRIESATDKDGYLCLTAAHPNSRNAKYSNGGDSKPNRYPGKLGWLERGGEHLHFTLYKENKDTMEVIAFLVRQLKLSAKAFQFAGTKDRRAVSVQRVSAYRVEAERLVKQNLHLRNSALGNFEYQKSGLELGDLGGNEFVLTLRECQFPDLPKDNLEKNLPRIQSALNSALTNLRTEGFINYYGLQRFGTFSTRTDTIGRLILKNDFRAACEAILHYTSEALAAAEKEQESESLTPTQAPHSGPGRDDILRAKAINLFQKTGNAHKPLEILPRKFSAENQIMRHLARSPTDYIGALLAIPRNLRLMYVHAYQSFVWNHAASYRWETYRDVVGIGDLVLVKEHTDKQQLNIPEPETGDVDADGEVIIKPESHDRSAQADDVFERARRLTAADIESGRYTIFDVVLPLPGYDVLLPQGGTAQFYRVFMGSDEGGNLDPENMRRRQKDFSLSGGYRKLMARIGPDSSVEVHRYARDEEQFVQTDLEKVKDRNGADEEEVEAGQATGEVKAVTENVKMQDIISEIAGEEKDKVAVVLKFQLGASQYATMALRELSRGGVVGYKADFSGGR